MSGIAVKVLKLLIWGLLLFFGTHLVQASWLVTPSLQLPKLTVSEFNNQEANWLPPVLTSLAKDWWLVEVPIAGGGQLLPPTNQSTIRCHQQLAIETMNNIAETSRCELLVGSTFAVQSTLAPRWQHVQGINNMNISNQRIVENPGEIIISEVMWAGSYEGEHSRAYDEWLELFNTTSDYLLLDNLQLKNAAYFNQILTFPTGVGIAPYSYLLVAHYAPHNSQLRVKPDVVLSSLQLSNNEANLQLVTIEGQIIDELPAGSWLEGANDTSQRIRSSAQRLFVNESGNNWSNWKTCQLAATTPELQAVYWQPTAVAHNCASPGNEQLY